MISQEPNNGQARVLSYYFKNSLKMYQFVLYYTITIYSNSYGRNEQKDFPISFMNKALCSVLTSQITFFLAFQIAAKLYDYFGYSLISASFCKLLNRLINKLKSFFELSANKLWSLCAVRSNGFSCERSHSMLTELKGKLATVVPFLFR